MRLFKSTKLFALFLVLGLASAGAFAGADHKHGPGGTHTQAKAINANEAKEAAKDVVKKLAEKGKLDKSWIKLTAASATQKKFKDQTEWVVTFNNPAGAKGKQKLFVFLSMNGDYLGANHTGQ